MGTTKFTGWYNILLEFAGGVGVVCVGSAISLGSGNWEFR